MIHHSAIIVLFLLTVNLFSATAVQAASVLNIVNRIDEPTHLQIFLHFDQVPALTTETTGRRVNVELEDTVVAETMETISTDERMIRMVSRKQGDNTVLSFYFRYPPQKVTTERREETGMLMLDIVPGNPLSARYPELSAQFNGVTVLSRRTSDSLNPVNISPYVHDWKSFFTLHEAPVTIAPPPRLGLPPFPLAAAIAPEIAVDQWLSPEIKALAEASRWHEASLVLREHLTEHADEPLKERLLLTYTETLVRAGAYREPSILLQSITREYPETPMATLAELLFTFLEADKGDVFSAAHELESLCRHMEDAALFPAHCTMLRAETILASGRTAEAKAMLAELDLGKAPQLHDRCRLRRADLLYDAKDMAAALTAYRELSEQQPQLIHTDPLSLARFSDLLYSAQYYQEAGKNYRILGELLRDKPFQDLALFREAMSQLRFPETEPRGGRIGLVQIQDAFPQTEGGERALLKQTDLDYAAERIDAAGAATAYTRLSREAGTVALREEASFKLALVNALAGHHYTSVKQCMDVLRGFQSGALRTETMALLFQQLPDVIRQLVHDQEYIQALVLAMQNRTYFARGWLGTGLLYDIAQAYSALGLINETLQTYQYLFEISLPTEAEQLYLPFIRTLSRAGQYVRAEEFAERYFLRHPQGKDGPTIFLLKVHALFNSGRDDQAIRLLESDHRLHTPQLSLLGARIYFFRQQWMQVIDTLTDPDLESFLTIGEPLYFLAESYFQTGQITRATPLFRQLAARGIGSDQAGFRLAQIAAQQENKQEALNLFEELAEKGTDPLWTGLAREQAAILQLKQ